MTCVLGLVLVIGSSCSSGAPTAASVTEEITASKTVLAIDADTREITLAGEDGDPVVIVAGPEVRNFDQVKAGNTVNAIYSVTLAVRRLAPNEVAAAVTTEDVEVRAVEGEAPAAGVGSSAAIVTTVESINMETYEVVLIDPAGQPHTVQAKQDIGKAFVDGLRAGDRVEIAYGEAVVISVD